MRGIIAVDHAVRHAQVQWTKAQMGTSLRGKVDLTIYGAGAFGLSCGYEASKRGLRVRVIDPNGVGAGASGGVVGALAPHTPERWDTKKEFQFQSLILSREHWPEVEETGGLSSGYGPVGRVQAIVDQGQLRLAYERIEQAKELWRGMAEWRVVSQSEAGDWAPISPTGYLVHDTLSARINPWRACAALAAAIIALGGDVVSEGAEEGVVIHATGWWGLKAMSEAFGQEVGNGVKGQGVLLDLAVPDAPQLYGEMLHVIPHRDGTTAIGSTSERYFDSPDQTDEKVDDLLARARGLIPALRDAREIRRWAGVRPRAKTRAPMLGAWPGRPGHFIANGGFKIGFGMAPMAARVLMDLVLENRDMIPEEFKVEASL